MLKSFTRDAYPERDEVGHKVAEVLLYEGHAADRGAVDDQIPPLPCSKMRHTKSVLVYCLRRQFVQHPASQALSLSNKVRGESSRKVLPVAPSHMRVWMASCRCAASAEKRVAFSASPSTVAKSAMLRSMSYRNAFRSVGTICKELEAATT